MFCFTLGLDRAVHARCPCSPITGQIAVPTPVIGSYALQECAVSDCLGTGCHGAAPGAHMHVVLALIVSGVQPLPTCSQTALCAAAFHGHADTCTLLLYHGCNINKKMAGDKTILHLAAHRGHGDVVRVLMQHGADARDLDARGWTPLHYVSRHCSRFFLSESVWRGKGGPYTRAKPRAALQTCLHTFSSDPPPHTQRCTTGRVRGPGRLPARAAEGGPPRSPRWPRRGNASVAGRARP